MQSSRAELPSFKVSRVLIRHILSLQQSASIVQVQLVGGALNCDNTVWPRTRCISLESVHTYGQGTFRVVAERAESSKGRIRDCGGGKGLRRSAMP